MNIKGDNWDSNLNHLGQNLLNRERGHLTLYQILLKLLSKKMDRREDVLERVEGQYEGKHLTRAPLEGCEILFFQPLNFTTLLFPRLV
jgi:hypothetical protein